MQHAIALVFGAGRQIGQPLPMHQIPGADDTCLSSRRRQLLFLGLLALAAEHAVYVAVLVLGQTHIVDVGLLRIQIRQLHGIIPEPEPVHRAVALRQRKKGFAVVALHPGHQIVFPVPVQGAGVEHRIDAQPLHEIRVPLPTEVVFPERRDVVPGQHRVAIAVKDPVIERRPRIFPGDRFFVLPHDGCFGFVKHLCTSA